MQPQIGIRAHIEANGICQGHNCSGASGSQSQGDWKESNRRVVKGNLFKITWYFTIVASVS